MDEIKQLERHKADRAASILITLPITEGIFPHSI